MRVGSIIKGHKANISAGPWSEEKLRSKDFPLLKKKGRVYPVTRRWRWQISSFEAVGRKFRVMASYHSLLPEFMAVLAEDVGQDCRILARWEFHESHGGWHAHSCCEDIDKQTPGLVKTAGTVRIPAAGTYHRHRNLLNEGYDMNDKIATAIAFDLCGLPQNYDMFVKSAVPWF